jgi:hypothetical protein
MRCAVAMLAILTTGGLSVAFANPPATPAAPEESAGTPAQSSTPQDRGSQNNAPQSAPATAGATTPEKSAVAPASDEPLQEKWLRNQGYKPYMRNSEKVFCKRETPIGSHLATTLHCLTVAEAELIEKEGKDTVARLQRNMTSCFAPGAHGGANCGN